MTQGSIAAAPLDYGTRGEFPLTDGVLAMGNLEAQIEGYKRRIQDARFTGVGDQAEVIELVALRGQILGLIRDYEWAELRAEQLTSEAPLEGEAFVSRARARSRFHRFGDALTDLDRAQQLRTDPTIVETERAGILQAIGRYDAALAIYSDAAKQRAHFALLGALAKLHAERGEIAIAEKLFDVSRDRYHGVSPFPPAMLNFQR